MMVGEGLKGASFCVFAALIALREAGEPVSISRLAHKTTYAEYTVRRALADLESWGYIRRQRPGRGHRYSYKILERSL